MTLTLTITWGLVLKIVCFLLGALVLGTVVREWIYEPVSDRGGRVVGVAIALALWAAALGWVK